MWLAVITERNEKKNEEAQGVSTERLKFVKIKQSKLKNIQPETLAELRQVLGAKNRKEKLQTPMKTRLRLPKKRRKPRAL